MTLLEILVSIALFILLSFSVATSVNSYHAKESFHASLDTITGALSRARTETLTSLNDMQYGVHVDSFAVTIFSGSTYSAAAADNVLLSLQPGTEISAFSLAGGGADVIFDRITGKTSEGGTITVHALGDGTLSDVTIQSTGVIFSQ